VALGPDLRLARRPTVLAALQDGQVAEAGAAGGIAQGDLGLIDQIQDFQ
jgi:hypothetical protein